MHLSVTLAEREEIMKLLLCLTDWKILFSFLVLLDSCYDVLFQIDVISKSIQSQNLVCVNQL